MLNRIAEQEISRMAANTVAIEIGNYLIERLDIDNLKKHEHLTDPLWQRLVADGWEEKSRWLQSQDAPHKIVMPTHNHWEENGVRVKIILITTSENATMFRLTFGG